MYVLYVCNCTGYEVYDHQCDLQHYMIFLGTWMALIAMMRYAVNSVSWLLSVRTYNSVDNTKLEELSSKWKHIWCGGLHIRYIYKSAKHWFNKYMTFTKCRFPSVQCEHCLFLYFPSMIMSHHIQSAFTSSRNHSAGIPLLNRGSRIWMLNST